jgi:GDPmannose 4,6-dehydratase
MNRCVIIGHKGQDGRILSDFLRKRGGHVIGISRGDLDLTDESAVDTFVEKEKPDQIYYLAAFHHSSEDRECLSEAEIFRRSFEVHFNGLITFLESIKKSGTSIRLFYAASSHVFGEAVTVPQNEETPFRPTNIYGISKAAGIESCRYYREKHGVFAATGILYNHESAFRSAKFVSQKIVRGAVAISRGQSSSMTLGNLEARIDWGFAPDFIEAMTLIMGQAVSDDYVIGTGASHSVREFVEIAFSQLGLDWKNHVRVDESLIARKANALLVGDSSKLRERTRWTPKTSFEDMISNMIKAALHED